MEETSKKLPDKLSDLIRVAVADMRKVAKNPAYVLDAYTWHEPREADDGSLGPCLVCMAGAVMAGTLGSDPEEPLSTGDFEEYESNRLDALDDVRTGHCLEALIRIQDEPPSGNEILACEQASSTIRATYRNGFAAESSYEQAADILAEAGL